MTKLTMSLVPSELTQPVLDGEVVAQGPDWSISAGKSVDANSREMLNGAFDVAEMSLATFLKAHEQGRDLIGLPIFTGRGFLQPAVVCRAGISKPEELAGKKIGLPQLWMTSSVWHRGILQEQHGVHQNQVEWLTQVEERFDDVSPPPSVSVGRLPQGLTVKDALAVGAVDAIMVPPRGARGLGETFSRPYADVIEAQRSYFVRTGVWPIMHFVVMRQSVQAAMPSLPAALIAAFSEAKRLSAARSGLPDPIAGLPSDEPASLFGSDPWKYGLEANRRPLETFLRFTAEQGWLAQPKSLEDYFVPGALDLQG